MRNAELVPAGSISACRARSRLSISICVGTSDDEYHRFKHSENVAAPPKASIQIPARRMSVSLDSTRVGSRISRARATLAVLLATERWQEALKHHLSEDRAASFIRRRPNQCDPDRK